MKASDLSIAFACFGDVRVVDVVFGGFVAVRCANKRKRSHDLLERLGHHRCLFVVRWKQLTWCGGRLYVLLHIRLFHLVFFVYRNAYAVFKQKSFKKVNQATQRIFIS